MYIFSAPEILIRLFIARNVCGKIQVFGGWQRRNQNSADVSWLSSDTVTPHPAALEFDPYSLGTMKTWVWQDRTGQLSWRKELRTLLIMPILALSKGARGRWSHLHTVMGGSAETAVNRGWGWGACIVLQHSVASGCQMCIWNFLRTLATSTRLDVWPFERASLCLHH